MTEAEWTDFQAMVDAVRKRMAEVIDEVTDGEPEASGRLAGRIIAFLMAQFLSAAPDSPFPSDVNDMLAAFETPFRLFKVTAKDGNSVELEVGSKLTVA